MSSCSATAGGFSKTFMSIDSNGDRPRTTFFTDTIAIYCGGTFSSGTTDVTVNAVVRETALSGTPVNVIISNGEEAPGKGTNNVVFQLSKVTADGTMVGDNEAWPVGNFQCELSVNGDLKATLPFSIETPACPVYPAQDGTVCQGFYSVGSICPAADQTRSCTCEATGTWSCPM
jgi:hypothetical protein